MKQVLYLALALIICSACDNLSRGKAKSEIIKNMQLPQAETAQLNKTFKKDHQYVGFGKVCFSNIKSFKNYETQLLDLQAKGYISLKDDEYYNDCNDLYTHVLLTNKGKRDLVKEDDNNYYIKICSLEFGEVTGIVEYKELKVADVNYTIVRKGFSDFGELVYKLSYPNSQRVETINRLTNFTKYDDGWRMR